MARVLDKRVVKPGFDVAREAPGSVIETPADPPAEIVTRRSTTTRFGIIDVDLDLVIVLPEGMIGFESCREYVVVRHDDTSAFRWLQSLDEPGVAFPIVEPAAFRPDYAPTISDSDARMLGLRHDTPTLLFVVVSVPSDDPSGMTANLLAPLVINGSTRQGKQVIVQDEGYTTRHGIIKELERSALLPLAVGGVSSDATVTQPSVTGEEARAA
jgi:flagellar assembly factor FliW